jgi:hypothetical protein
MGVNINEENKDKVSIQDDIIFNVFDKVYMNSPFGVYTGEVKSINDGKMTIESHSPTGNGSMWADYDIKGTDWRKY